MKLKSTVIIAPVEDKFVLVDSDETKKEFHGMIKLNSTGAFIAELLKDEITLPELVKKLCDKYDVTPEKAEESVKNVVTTLGGVGLIETE